MGNNEYWFPIKHIEIQYSMGSRIWIALGFTSQFCSWQAGQKQREVDFSRTVSTGSEKSSSLEIWLHRWIQNWLCGAASEVIGRPERSVAMPTLMKWRASLMIMANVTIMSSFMFPPCIAGGNTFAHLYWHVEHVEIMQSCFQALRSPDKISGQNVEIIVSKSIALKLDLFAMLGMFANMQWCYYTALCCYMYCNHAAFQDKMLKC